MLSMRSNTRERRSVVSAYLWVVQCLCSDGAAAFGGDGNCCFDDTDIHWNRRQCPEDAGRQKGRLWVEPALGRQAGLGNNVLQRSGNTDTQTRRRR